MLPPKSLIPPEAPTVPLTEASDNESSIGAVNADPPVTVGSLLAARYQLTELLGEGGTSRVYKAIDMQRQVEGARDTVIAVKVLTRSLDALSEAFNALREQVRRWRRLEHPQIVRLIDCETDGAIVFITMEYVAGESVYAKLQDRRAATRVAAHDAQDFRKIIRLVGDALEYAHQQGVVHGDFKPGNILVSGAGAVKVIDFGMTRWLMRPALDGAARPTPAASPLWATPRYASPELLAGEAPQPADDVFSLACVAYEILSGAHPFGEDESTGKPLPPLRPGMTADEHAALRHALEPTRRARTHSIRQFIDEFTAPSKASSGRRWPFWLAAGVLACIGWIYLRPGRDGAAPPAPSVAQPVPAAPPSTASPKVAQQPSGVIRDCPTCPAMTVVPAGQFQQGADAEEPNSSSFEKPRHLVRIDYPLAMSTTAVTVDEFREFIEATGRDVKGCEIYDGAWRGRAAASWKDPGFQQSPHHPVTCISWKDAVAFADWLSGKTGQRYRLPSASEWEYAARAGGDMARPWSAAAQACGSANVADQSAERRYPGWNVFPCDDGFVNTAPVGSFKPNAFGLSDMLGNVFVWTQDCWQADYAKAPADGSAAAGGDCREHELRGGSWFSAPAVVKASYRSHFPVDYRTSSVGFRLVREIEP